MKEEEEEELRHNKIDLNIALLIQKGHYLSVLAYVISSCIF